ncbi:DUF5959 family protein [Myceligenerans indicum]|uniref:Uncharacterized protein n=1 Tax=Myceligenerans indicum TaxID=2593663 RepID=A0ABS1LJM3_9MICO|nr:DUF5959 family protein [Myceligenerans indicum]MBL0886373.1 hypothetical protein [Myceligenerans indicum]
MAEFVGEGGRVALDVVNIIPREGGGCHGLDVEFRIDTELVQGSRTSRLGVADLTSYRDFLASVEGSRATHWRRHARGMGLSLDVTDIEVGGQRYPELLLLAVDANSGSCAGIIVHPDTAWFDDQRLRYEQLMAFVAPERCACGPRSGR